MLHEKTKSHISNLTDSELVEYVLTGTRMYEPEAIAYARAELERRKLPPDSTSELHRVALANVAAAARRRYRRGPAERNASPGRIANFRAMAR